MNDILKTMLDQYDADTALPDVGSEPRPATVWIVRDVDERYLKAVCYTQAKAQETIEMYVEDSGAEDDDEKDAIRNNYELLEMPIE